MEKSEKEILEVFHRVVAEMGKSVDPYANQKITTENIFQPAVLNNRQIFKNFLETLLLEGSGVEGKDYLRDFYRNFQEGKSSLILSEHKSNFDVPIFYVLMYHQEAIFREIFEKIVFVAGRKLNEEEIFVKLMAEQFHRVIVVPKTETARMDSSEVEKAIQINMATQKFIRDKKKDYIFLVFPTGTRSKPWDHSTYNGIRETFNYLKNFEQMIFLSINGNCMVPRKTSMSQEIPRKDVIKLIFSEPKETAAWIKETRRLWEASGKTEDFKQFGINRVMEEIYSQKGVLPWEENQVFDLFSRASNNNFPNLRVSRKD